MTVDEIRKACFEAEIKAGKPPAVAIVDAKKTAAEIEAFLWPAPVAPPLHTLPPPAAPPAA